VQAYTSISKHKTLSLDKHKPKLVQQHIDSMSRVYPERKHGLGAWGNPRVPMTIRVDSGLKSAFKSVAKAQFGSTCNPLECVMAAIVGVCQNPKLDGVYPSITIGEIKIERNLRERRKVTRTVETETVYERMDKNLASVKKAAIECAPKIAVDYSSLSTEELQRRHARALSKGLPDSLILAIHLKKRGVSIDNGS
jgi:hypothetical protein